jgi:rubrerythrin
MSFESIEEIIDFAVEREKEAVAFYEDAIKQESYVGARKTFEAFATEERKHVALLEGFLRGETRLTESNLREGDVLSGRPSACHETGRKGPFFV